MISSAPWQAFSRNLGRLLVVVLALCAAMVAAETAVATTEPAQLWLSPRSCVPAQADTPCVERIRIRWQLSTDTPFCIWQHGGAQPLFCDQRAIGERELLLPINETTRFELVEQAGSRLLGSAEILVMASADASKRRRYKHPWSIF